MQVSVGIILEMCMLCSYIYLFESRSSFLTENRFRMTRKTTRFLYHLSIFLFIGACIIHFFKFPANQETAKLDALKVFPCPTKEFFLFDVLILLPDENDLHLFLYVLFPLIVAQFGSNVLFHVLCSIYYLYIAPSNVVSRETRQLQKRFLIGVSCQTSVPLIFLGIPLIVMLATSLNPDNYSQKTMNISMIGIACHGLAESIAIVTVHRPYRTAVKQMLNNGCCKRYRSYVVMDVNNIVSISSRGRGLT